MRHELISTAVHLSLASALAEPPHLCAVSRPLCFVSHSSNGACHAPWPKPQGRCSLQVVSCVHDGSIYNFQKKAVPAQAAGLPSHHTVPGVTMTSVWVWALLLPSVCRLLFLSELQFLYFPNLLSNFPEESLGSCLNSQSSLTSVCWQTSSIDQLHKPLSQGSRPCDLGVTTT